MSEFYRQCWHAAAWHYHITKDEVYYEMALSPFLEANEKDFGTATALNPYEGPETAGCPGILLLP